MPKKYVKGRKKFSRKNRKVVKRRYPALKSSNPFMPKGPLTKYNDINPFPATLNTKFVYSGWVELSSTGSSDLVGGTYQFNLGSAYDPYSGTLPTNLDNYCYGYTKLLASDGPYRRYKVNAVKLDILFHDPKGTDSDSTVCVVQLRHPNSTTSINAKSLEECDRMPQVHTMRISDSGTQKRRLTQYIPMYQAFGWTKDQYHNDMTTTTGPYNNSPSSMATLVIGVSNARGPSSATSVMCKIKITYYTMLYDRYNSFTD